MNVRRIGYLTSQYPKISHSFIRREILALERLGWEVHRFAMRGWDAEVLDPADIAEVGKTNYALRNWGTVLWSVFCTICTSPLRFSQALLLCCQLMRHSDRSSFFHLIYLAEACWVTRKLVQHNIRHLHVHFGTNPTDIAIFTQKLSTVTFSFTVHGPEEFDRGIAINLKKKLESSLFTVAISSFGRAQLIRLLDFKSWSKVKVVHCGVDELFKRGDVAANTSNRFVCVGRLCEQKGQALLVAAAARLYREGESFELRLIGDGEHRGIIENLIVEQKLDGVVKIIGWADGETVRREMLSARALVLPSFAEGLPVVLLEAMALGRPVLTTYIAGIPELVTDGKSGWLFPAGSEDALVSAMRRSLHTSDLALQSMGENARVQAFERHDIDTEARKLDALFAEALRL